MSRGNSAGGLQQQVAIRTAPDLLLMKPAPYQHDVDEGGKVTVSLPSAPAGARVRSVLSVSLRETISEISFLLCTCHFDIVVVGTWVGTMQTGMANC